MNVPARMVIGFVGAVTVIALVIIGILAIRDQQIPTELATIPPAGMTGLLGLLVNTRPTEA